MKRYYIDGVEVTEEEAKETERKNREYIKSPDISDWKKCRIIIAVNR